MKLFQLHTMIVFRDPHPDVRVASMQIKIPVHMTTSEFRSVA